MSLPVLWLACRNSLWWSLTQHTLCVSLTWHNPVVPRSTRKTRSTSGSKSKELAGKSWKIRVITKYWPGLTRFEPIYWSSLAGKQCCTASGRWQACSRACVRKVFCSSSAGPGWEQDSGFCQRRPDTECWTAAPFVSSVQAGPCHKHCTLLLLHKLTLSTRYFPIPKFQNVNYCHQCGNTTLPTGLRLIHTDILSD